MKIGIVGAGFIGRAVARLAVQAGHPAMVSNARGPGSLTDISSAIGCDIGTVQDAAGFGDLVLLAIPFAQIETLAAAPFAGKIILDANNYYPERDGQIAALDRRETTTSEIVAAHFAQSRIVKAFNAILARDLERGAALAPSGRPRALPIAGDDSAAKRVVAGLHGDFGFDCLDAGSLAESWRFERAKPAYCVPLDREGLASALAAALRNVELPHGSWRT